MDLPKDSESKMGNTSEGGGTTTTITGRETVEHGTRSCYQKGCRQPECREANARYKASRKAAHKARQKTVAETLGIPLEQVSLPTIEHGTANAYEYYECRCPRCKQGMEVIRRNRRFIKQLNAA